MVQESCGMINIVWRRGSWYNRIRVASGFSLRAAARTRATVLCSPSTRFISPSASGIQDSDEVGMLIYAGPYSNPACPECRAKPADQPVPAGSVQKAVASYVKVLRGVAPHPSHVILIISNENDISGTRGHWGDSPFAYEYAELLRNVTAALKQYDPSRVILADAGFGHGLGGEVMDDQ